MRSRFFVLPGARTPHPGLLGRKPLRQMAASCSGTADYAEATLTSSARHRPQRLPLADTPASLRGSHGTGLRLPEVGGPTSGIGNAGEGRPGNSSRSRQWIDSTAVGFRAGWIWP